MKRLLVTLLTFTSWACLAQGTNSIFPAQTFTASGQTGAAIQLNRAANASTIGSSFNVGTITVTGTFSTVTFAVQGSSDNSGNYYPLPITPVTASASPTSTVTATGGGLYQINLAGITHIQFVTSGTFTGTSVSLVLTASPNGSLAHNGPCAGCAQIPTGQVAQPTLNASACSTSFAPSWCSGGQIGAWVQSAVTKLAGAPGTILVDATQSSWPQSTQISLPLNVQFECQGSPLVWQNTSGVAISYASAGGSSSGAASPKISNCYFQGPGNVNTSTNIGMYLGGDPAGAITPSAYYGAYVTLDNVKIYGFNTGWTNGNNTFIVSLHHVKIEDNYNNLVSVGSGTGGVTNSGENMVLDSGSVIDNAANYGMYFNGFNSRWHITDTSFDYNVGGNIFGNVNADFKSIHSEGATQCQVSVPANGPYNLHVYGGEWYINNATANTGFICLPSRNSQGLLSLEGGVTASNNGTVSDFVFTGGTTPLNLCPSSVSITYNFASQPQSWLVDSGSFLCGFWGTSGAGELFIGGNAALGISQMLSQGNMVTSGGTGSTTVPYWLFNLNSPVAVSTWGNAGTVLGVNAPAGFGGVFFDMRINGGASVFKVTWQGLIQATQYTVISACINAASPAVCGSNSSGFVAVPSTGTTLQVNTTAGGTTHSQIYLDFDSSLGTSLGITCDTAIAQPTVSARNLTGVAGGSFTVTMSAVPTSGKFACLSYNIYN